MNPQIQDEQYQALHNKLGSFERIQDAQNNLGKQEDLVIKQIDIIYDVIKAIKEYRAQLQEVTDLPIRFPARQRQIITHLLSEYKK